MATVNTYKNRKLTHKVFDLVKNTVGLSHIKIIENNSDSTLGSIILGKNGIMVFVNDTNQRIVVDKNTFTVSDVRTYKQLEQWLYTEKDFME